MAPARCKRSQKTAAVAAHAIVVHSFAATRRLLQTARRYLLAPIKTAQLKVCKNLWTLIVVV